MSGPRGRAPQDRPRHVERGPRPPDRDRPLLHPLLILGVIHESMEPEVQLVEIGSKPKPEEKGPEEKKPADPFGEPEKAKDGKLYDKEGREYRVCPQCGYNMYKQGKMWVCENCGYSYVE